jgi:hypothetical protein
VKFPGNWLPAGFYVDGERVNASGTSGFFGTGGTQYNEGVYVEPSESPIITLTVHGLNLHFQLTTGHDLVHPKTGNGGQSPETIHGSATEKAHYGINIILTQMLTQLLLEAQVTMLLLHGLKDQTLGTSCGNEWINWAELSEVAKP